MRILTSALMIFFAAGIAFPARSLAQGNDKDNAVPTWNTNGRIYFKSGPQGKGDVYSVKEDGTGLRPFITSPGEDYAPRWTHDGKRGVFMSERDGDLRSTRSTRTAPTKNASPTTRATIGTRRGRQTASASFSCPARTAIGRSTR